MRGATHSTAQHSSTPPPWLIPPEQHILLRQKAEMMPTEYDGNVSALPISGTQRSGKAYVSGAVTLFSLKCIT